MSEEATATTVSCSPKRTPAELLSIAKECKQAGNKLYIAKDYWAATKQYHHGLLHIKAIESNQFYHIFLKADSLGSRPYQLTQELQAEIALVKTDIFNNLAACLLKKTDCNYEKVVHYCDEVLKEFPNNVKALNRKGVALFYMEKYDDSMEHFKKSMKHGDKHDNFAARYIECCESKLRAYKEKEKDIYRRMFQAGSQKS